MFLWNVIVAAFAVAEAKYAEVVLRTCLVGALNSNLTSLSAQPKDANKAIITYSIRNIGRTNVTDVFSASLARARRLLSHDSHRVDERAQRIGAKLLAGLQAEGYAEVELTVVAASSEGDVNTVVLK